MGQASSPPLLARCMRHRARGAYLWLMPHLRLLPLWQHADHVRIPPRAEGRSVATLLVTPTPQGPSTAMRRSAHPDPEFEGAGPQARHQDTQRFTPTHRERRHIARNQTSKLGGVGAAAAATCIPHMRMLLAARAAAPADWLPALAPCSLGTAPHCTCCAGSGWCRCCQSTGLGQGLGENTEQLCT